MVTLKDLNTKGVFGVFTMANPDNLLVVAHFKDKTLYCVKEKAFINIPREFSDPNVQAFIKEIYDHVALTWRLPKAKLTTIKDIVFEGDFEITGIYKTPVGVGPVSIRFLKDFFDSKGFDISNLAVSLETKKHVRDYTSLVTSSAEARERIQLIKKAIKDKKMPEKYEVVAEAIKQGEFTLVYLVGPAGTGKTMLTYFFADYCGAPLLTAQGSEGVTADTLIGCSDVKTDYAPSSVDIDSTALMSPMSASSFTVIEGQLLKAYREGYQIVIDEANYMLPGIMAVINSMVDDTPTYEFKGKIIKRHPNFVLYLTSNPGYEGTYLYNPATKSRGLTLLIDKLTQEEFMARMYSNYPVLSLDFYKALYPFQDLIQEYADKWGESSAICIRHASNFVKLITAKPQSFEGFKESFAMAYLYNGLCMDNDNSAKVDILLKDKDFIAKLESLYSNYDYKIVPEVEPTIDFTEAFKSFDIEWAKDTVESSIDDIDFESTFDEEDFK